MAVDSDVLCSALRQLRPVLPDELVATKLATGMLLADVALWLSRSIGDAYCIGDAAAGGEGLGRQLANACQNDEGLLRKGNAKEMLIVK